MSPRKPRLTWTWLSTIFVTLLVADLCALTWYLWKISPDLQPLVKTVSTVAGWISSAMAFWGIKHVTRKKLSLVELISLRPVRASMIVLTAGIWFFILPFHWIKVDVRGPDGKPLAGVMATVDGDMQGNASDEEGRLSIGGLLACTHSIQLEKTGYKKPSLLRPHFAEVLAMGRLHPPPLERAEGTVTLLSDPPGAAIYVDSETEKRGVAGTPIWLPLGTPHIITLKLAGYQPWSEKVTVSAERLAEPGTRKLQALPVQPAHLYPVDVVSDRAGAEIWVKNKFKGTTPAKLWLRAGEYKIDLKTGSENQPCIVSVPAQRTCTP